MKRSLSSYFTKTDDKAVQKRETSEKSPDANTSKLDALIGDYKFPSRRRRQIEDDDEDDDEDNEIGSGDNSDTTPDPDPVTSLPPVKDDKYCKNFSLSTFNSTENFLPFKVRLKLTVGEFWREDFKNKKSDDFKELAGSMKKAIEDIYDTKNTESTTIMAQVVEVR